MSYFKSKEANIYYEVHGKGPVILMIAGMASDCNSWQFILKEMSKNYCLLTFDNRGCGRTESIIQEFNIVDMADDALGLIDHLGHEKVHIISHSMGGMIAQELALKHPDRIEKMVLASTGTRLSPNSKAMLDDLYDKWASGYDMAEWFRILFKGLFSKKALSNKKFMDAAIIFALSYPYAQSLEGFKSQVDALEHFNIGDNIQDINPETLILSGAEDILFTPEESRELLKIKGSCFRLIESAAHSIHAEHPDLFCEVVLEFLGAEA